MSAGARPAPRWLHGRLADLLLGCHGGYLALFIGFLLFGPTWRAAQPGWLAPLLILLVSTPHYGATLVRVYEQRAERRAYALYAFGATFALLALFVLGVRNAAVGTLLFTAYLTWSPWHYTAQNFGVAMTFLGRRGLAPDRTGRRLLHAAFILSFVLTFLVMHREDGAARGLAAGGVHLARLGLPDPFASVAIPIVAIACAVTFAAALPGLLRRGSIADLAPLGLLALSQCVWFVLPDLFRVAGTSGGVEALAFDHRAYYFNWIVLAHAVQYLWITSYYARAGGDWPGLAPYFGKTLLAGNVAWLVPALVFAPQLLGGAALETDVALLVAALVNLHHFVVDGAIWKLRRAKVGDVLIRSRSGSPAPVVRGRRLRPAVVAFWSGAALLLGLALFEFGAREIAIPGRASAGDLDGASRWLDRLGRVGRDSATLRLRLGVAFAEEGRPAEAQAAFARALELAPDWPPAREAAAWASAPPPAGGRRS